MKYGVDTTKDTGADDDEYIDNGEVAKDEEPLHEDECDQLKALVVAKADAPQLTRSRPTTRRSHPPAKIRPRGRTARL